jgi:hypothetical protein
MHITLQKNINTTTYVKKAYDMSPAAIFKKNSPRTSSHLPPVLICYIKPDEKTFRNT